MTISIGSLIKATEEIRKNVERNAADNPEYIRGANSALSALIAMLMR